MDCMDDIVKVDTCTNDCPTEDMDHYEKMEIDVSTEVVVLLYTSTKI